jgi:lysophospholipase
MSDGGGQPAPDLVIIPGNPPPENAEAIWYEGKGGKLRMMFAAERSNEKHGGGQKTRGTVFVCPGRTEFIEKYFEVARDLQGRGFAVAIFDWPGQGLSQRQHRHPLAGHIRSYGVFVDAMVRGIDKLGRRAPKPHIVLAHSMGGTISLEALRTKKVEVAAAAFSAPMWGLPIWFFQRWYARGVRLFGFGGMIARPPGLEETFATNPLSHDEKRWRLYHDLVAAEPRLKLGEPTVAWVVASLNVVHEFFAPSALDHLRNLPALIAVAGEEAVVKNAATRKLARRFKAGKAITVKGSGHEILMETDERRAEFWKAFDAMLKHANI